MKLWNEMTLLEQYICIYSDMHKDAYGFRPRNDISEWTEDDWQMIEEASDSFRAAVAYEIEARRFRERQGTPPF